MEMSCDYPMQVCYIDEEYPKTKFDRRAGERKLQSLQSAHATRGSITVIAKFGQLVSIKNGVNRIFRVSQGETEFSLKLFACLRSSCLQLHSGRNCYR